MPLIFPQLHDGFSLIWPRLLFCFEAVLHQSWALHFQEGMFVAMLRLRKKLLLEIELFSRPGKNHWVSADLIEAQQGGKLEKLVKTWSTTQVLAAVELEAEEGEEVVVVKELK